MSTPDALLATRDTVVWWGFVAGAEHNPATQPWRADERRALAASGVELPDDSATLLARSQGWRRAVLAARRRLILVVPASVGGAPSEPHPFWSELVGRLGATPADVARLRCTVDELPRRATVPVELLDPLALPPARRAWSVPPRAIVPPASLSAHALESLLGCPLRWVLRAPARLREQRLDELPRDHKLAGTLGHRLVEELHRDGAFALDAPRLRARAEQVFDELLPREGASLLVPGQASERAQLRAQLTDAVVALHRLLAASALRISAVEESLDVALGPARLTGRIDLLLDGSDGEAILDLKWGTTQYRDAVEGGVALQLAVYLHARRLATGTTRPVPVGYFSLSVGQLYTTDATTFAGVAALAGPSAAETWARAAATLGAVEASLARGSIPVAGVAGAPPLLDALAVPPENQRRHVVLGARAACPHCTYDAICGRRWEALA